MSNLHDDSAALKALQDDIYRERVLRARSLTMEQRLAEAFEITNSVFERMLEGAMWQKGTTDRAEGWREVRRRLDRLSRLHDSGRFTSTRPNADEC
ncbi:MAG TPA: hypothetical protein PLA50_14960 [Bacteroidia bacterium]|nr:hypothetical protein [Bacteroidia bacterium]